MRLLITLVATFFVASCANGLTPAGGIQSFEPVTPSQASEPGSDYRINPLDTLRISVFQEPELSVDGVPVATNGQIALPLIGQVPVEGRTTIEVASDIKARLAPYLVNASVAVNVVNYTSQRVTVEGAVEKPGIYPIQGGGFPSRRDRPRRGHE